MRLLSPQWMLSIAVVGLVGMLGLSICTTPQSPMNATGTGGLADRAPPQTAPSASPTGTGGLADRAKPQAALSPLRGPKNVEWLPSLVDDTRTVLTGFFLDVHQPGMPSMTTASGIAGPQLFQAGPPAQSGAPTAPSGPWYPETRPRSSSSSLPSSASASQPPRLLIVPPDAMGHRSRNLELIAREADIHTHRGFELAGRGAYFSARAEFIMAMRLLSQALDVERQTRMHTSALAAGLTALTEAEDFVPNGSGLEADLDLVRVIAGHRTTVLHGSSTEGLTPMTALQCYFTYAQEQLAASVDREVAGAMALYGLGKLHKAFSEQQATTVPVARAKAMVFYQATLLVQPQNHMASNDLGVLLSQAGRYEDARMALEHSVALHQGSTGWHNLAMVYQNLGHFDLAQRARWLAQVASQKEKTELARAASGQQPVEWVESQTFAQTPGQTYPTRQAATAAPRAPAATSNAPSPATPANVARSLFHLPTNKK